jgi:hypothetical protein
MQTHKVRHFASSGETAVTLYVPPTTPHPHTSTDSCRPVSLRKTETKWCCVIIARQLQTHDISSAHIFQHERVEVESYLFHIGQERRVITAQSVI